MLKSIKCLETVGSYGVWNQPIVIDDQGEQQVAQLFFVGPEGQPIIGEAGVPVEACLSCHCSDCTGRGMDHCVLDGPFSPRPTGWFIY